MLKDFAAGFALCIGILTVGAIAKSPVQSPAQLEEKYQAELADATPIKAGALTPDQRIHSKLFAERGYGEKAATLVGGATIPQLIAGSQDKLLASDAWAGLGPLKEPDTPEHFFGALAGTSDAVIRGTPVAKTSQITEDGFFLFTDYGIHVREVLKDNPMAPILADAVVTVTRPGGKIVLNGVVFIARDHYFNPLPMPGGDVLLFLKFVPESGSYVAASNWASFELVDPETRALNEDGVPPGVLGPPRAVLAVVRTASDR